MFCGPDDGRKKKKTQNFQATQKCWCGLRVETEQKSGKEAIRVRKNTDLENDNKNCVFYYINNARQWKSFMIIFVF